MADDIKENLPEELKVSSIAIIPHESRAFCAILDLSFSTRLAGGYDVPLVNESYVKTMPSGTINELGHSLMGVIHAFAQADGEMPRFYGKVGHQRWLLATGLPRG